MTTPRSDDVRIRLLGTVELVADHTRLGGPKQRLLLALLSVDPGRPVPVSSLVENLWSEDPPDDPLRSLQVHVSKLRSGLDASGVEASIDHRAGGYVLEIDPDVVDVQRFVRLTEEGTRLVDVDPHRARDLLGDALALWRGQPYGDLGDHPALRGEALRLEEQNLRARESRVAAELATGHHERVVAELQELTERHPLRETLWAQLLLALYRSGRQGAALEAYAQARRLFADELGVDPSRALQRLHERILRQDPALEPPGITPQAVKGGGGRGPDERSLAILPFAVMGATPEAAQLALGLHNDLLVELSKAPTLTVISRTSVMSYRNTGKPIPVIARELNAGTLIEGTLQSAGRRFRLSVQLVDGIRDTHRWVGTYDDELTTENLFAIQSDLAREIADALSAELAPERHGAGEDRPPTGNLEAYRLVAIGRSQFDRKTEESLRGAVASYEEAVALDPTYVNAWSGLADALMSMDAYGHGDRHELVPRAEKAVHRALALDPDSAEARTSLGVLHVIYQDGPAALGEFRRAISTRPSYADAHSWSCWVSLLTGRAEQGLATAVRAAELDPRAAEAHSHLALAHAAIGRPEVGVTAARLARRLSPYTTADLYEGICLYELGRFDEARAVLEPLTVGRRGELGVPWAGHGPDATFALCLVELGEPDRAREVLRGIDPAGYPFAAGLIHLALGELSAAEHAFAAATRLTAWPCLALHHYHQEVWARIAGTDAHTRLVLTARRSWGLAGEG